MRPYPLIMEAPFDPVIFANLVSCFILGWCAAELVKYAYRRYRNR